LWQSGHEGKFSEITDSVRTRANNPFPQPRPGSSYIVEIVPNHSGLALAHSYAQVPHPRRLLHSYITTLEFDPSKGTLRRIAQSPAGTNPIWVAAHPTDKSLILVTNEVTDGKVHLFKLMESGGLKLLESVGSAGEDPAHLAVLEDEVVVGNYLSGTILAISFSKSAPHLLTCKAPI
ncbi:hypothetical protein FRC10_005382, partial [Ceratobasidium sp. 414]